MTRSNERSSATRELEHVQAGLGSEQRVGPETRDRRARRPFASARSGECASRAIGPADVHRHELLPRTRWLRRRRPRRARPDRDRSHRVASRAARPRRARREHVEATREHADELARMGFLVQDRGVRARRSAVAVAAAEAVEVLDQSLNTAWRSSDCQKPASRAARKGLLLQHPGTSGRCLDERSRARPGGRRPRTADPSGSSATRASVRAACRAPPARPGAGSSASGSTKATSRPVTVSRRDEEELVACGELALDDRRREPRQQVPLDRPLERPGAELGAEPLLDQEVDRGLVPLDGPRPHPEPAARRAPSVSSFSSRLRMTSRPSGRKTTTRSSRFRNSGRNDRSTDLMTLAGVEARPDLPTKPTPGPVGIAEPRFEVRMITQWRRSTVRPLRSVSRPSSKTWRKTSQIVRVRLLELVEEQHRERLLAHRGDQRRRLLLARRRHRGGARGSPASGTRSCRGARADPRSRTGTH